MSALYFASGAFTAAALMMPLQDSSRPWIALLLPAIIAMLGGLAAEANR